MANATRIVDKAAGVFFGKYTGTTAAQNIHIGFKPGYIHAVNWTDGNTMWDWCKDDEANVIVTTTAVGSAAIAVTRLDNGTVIGFSLPSNAVINEDSDVYYFWAIPE